MRVRRPAGPFVLFFAFLASGACARDSILAPVPPDGAANVELRTDKAAYDRSEPGSVTIANQTSDTLYFGGCHDILERQVSGGWIEMAPIPSPCPALLLTSLPGVPITTGFDRRPATFPGTYRLRRGFQTYGTPFFRRSNTFLILE